MGCGIKLVGCGISLAVWLNLHISTAGKYFFVYEFEDRALCPKCPMKTGLKKSEGKGKE